MESAKNSADERRVRLPAQENVQNTVQDAGPAAVDPAPFRGRSIGQLPSGPGTTAMRQRAVLQMQRTHGNSMVMRQLDAEAQRQAEHEAAHEDAAPSEISGGGSHVSAGSGGVEVSGPTVNIKSPVVQADGVIRASTVVADSIVASSYTPGVGNLW